MSRVGFIFITQVPPSKAGNLSKERLSPLTREKCVHGNYADKQKNATIVQSSLQDPVMGSNLVAVFRTLLSPSHDDVGMLWRSYHSTTLGY